MKTKFINILLIGFCFILEFNSCKKDTPVTTTPNPQPTPCDTCLPAITTTGANTFGCRVNGKVWLPESGYMTVAIQTEYFSNELGITGNNYTRDESVGFSAKQINDTGYYNFATYPFSFSRAFYNNVNLTINYQAYPITKGFFHVTRLDLSNGIFSGTFAFDIYNNKNDTVHITDGRFDTHK